MVRSEFIWLLALFSKDYLSVGFMAFVMMFTGQRKSIEAIEIPDAIDGGVEYQTHVAGVGWQDAVANGAIAGTTSQTRRVEAVRIKLIDSLASTPMDDRVGMPLSHGCFRLKVENAKWIYDNIP